MSLVPDFNGGGATANESLAQTLVIGNVTGANDIAVSAPQKIDFAGDISLKNGVGANVVIDAIPLNAGAPLNTAMFYEPATNTVVYQNLAPTSENLAQTLLIGNSTGSTNIAVSNGQAVAYDGDIILTNNNGGVGTNVNIKTIPANLGPTLTDGLVYDPATFNVYTQPTQSLTAGTGISIVANAINNTGLLGLTAPNAGTGITIGGTATNPTITNSGVTGLTVANAGTGIGITGTATNPTITNTGVTQLTATNNGTGISIAGTPTVPVINNTGLLGLTAPNAGTGISIGGTATNPTITNAGVVGLTATNAGTGITIGGTSTVPTITNSGLLGLTNANNGTGISITGTATNPIINALGVGVIEYFTAVNNNSPGTIQPLVTGGAGPTGFNGLIVPLPSGSGGGTPAITLSANSIILPVSGALYRITVSLNFTSGAVGVNPVNVFCYLVYPGVGPYQNSSRQVQLVANNNQQESPAIIDYIMPTTMANQPFAVALSTFAPTGTTGIIAVAPIPSTSGPNQIPATPACVVNVVRFA